ncbi:MAG: hypothetical protein R2856_12540 [Caldilineaceae bacterium]
MAIPLIIAFSLEAYLYFQTSFDFSLVQWVLIGAAVFIAAIPILPNLEFFRVFEHELNHLVVDVLTLSILREFLRQ